MRKKRKSKWRSMNKQHRIIIIAIILTVLLILSNYIVNIVSLTIENRKLRAQQEKLVEERDRLKSKLKNVDSPDYIEEQARKQLRLMNPNEIIFLFDEEDGDAEK